MGLLVWQQFWGLQASFLQLLKTFRCCCNAVTLMVSGCNLITQQVKPHCLVHSGAKQQHSNHLQDRVAPLESDTALAFSITFHFQLLLLLLHRNTATVCRTTSVKLSMESPRLSTGSRQQLHSPAPSCSCLQDDTLVEAAEQDCAAATSGHVTSGHDYDPE